MKGCSINIRLIRSDSGWTCGTRTQSFYKLLQENCFSNARSPGLDSTDALNLDRRIEQKLASQFPHESAPKHPGEQKEEARVVVRG